MWPDWAIFVTNFLKIIYQIFGNFLGSYENIIFKIKLLWLATFWATFRNIGIRFIPVSGHTASVAKLGYFERYSLPGKPKYLETFRALLKKHHFWGKNCFNWFGPFLKNWATFNSYIWSHWHTYSDRCGNMCNLGTELRSNVLCKEIGKSGAYFLFRKWPSLMSLVCTTWYPLNMGDHLKMVC